LDVEGSVGLAAVVVTHSVVAVDVVVIIIIIIIIIAFVFIVTIDDDGMVDTLFDLWCDGMRRSGNISDKANRQIFSTGQEINTRASRLCFDTRA
jgi:hypothetical protein